MNGNNTNLELLKAPAYRVLLYANNITEHLKNIELSHLDAERSEWMQSIGYDIEEIEKVLGSLKTVYERMMKD